MSVDVDGWTTIDRRGYQLRLPDRFEPVETNPSRQELVASQDPWTGMVVGTYRWYQPLTGAMGLEATLGHVVQSREGVSVEVREDRPDRRVLGFVCDLQGSTTVELLALRLADNDVAVVEIDYPTALASDAGHLAWGVLGSVSTARVTGGG